MFRIFQWFAAVAAKAHRSEEPKSFVSLCFARHHCARYCANLDRLCSQPGFFRGFVYLKIVKT
jgi:hypothetical protein